MNNKYTYYNNCVNWDRNDVYADGGLTDMTDNRLQISRETFLKYVDRNELTDIETQLGYSQHHTQGLTMAADWHIEYFRSNLHGERVYGFRYSGIEYVFTKQEFQYDND